MKGWIKVPPTEATKLPSGWHQVREIWVVTACAVDVMTDERPGAKEPGYGAKVCPRCLATRDPS